MTPPNDDRTRTAPPASEPATVTSPPHAEGGVTGTQIQPSAPTHLFKSSLSPTLPDVPGFAVSMEIARGGMGVVYAAYDPIFDREVAIKVMHHGQDAGRFVVEAKVTAQLPHPSIPPVYVLSTLADGRPFLAMKMIVGRTLSDELKAADRADLPRLLGLFEGICQAVGYAHAQGIIHRDLKPSNVMVGSFGEVLVMDWGLAKELRIAECGLRNDAGGSDPPACSSNPQSAIRDPQSQVTVAGQVKGTPSYMAPEQARGEAVDARADVFALGGILAAMLTGRPPFRGETAHDTVRLAGAADLTECLAGLDGCGADAELIALAKRCLAPAAGDRFADGKAVAEAVAAYRAGVQERLQVAQRERAVHEAEAREQRKRRKVQQALAGVFALLLAAGSGFLWWHDRQRLAEDQRLSRNREGAVDLLEQAETGLRVGDAERAAEPLAQVEKRFAEGGADDLRPRFDRDQEELAMLRELEAIAATQRTASELMKLPRWKDLAPRLAGAFTGYGIAPGTTPPEAAARRITDSHIRETLLAYLEIWAVTDQNPAVREILARADPDAFRDAVRAASYTPVAMARGFRGQPVPAPPVWFAIGQGQDTRLPVPVREQILLAGLRERPNSVSILLALATLGAVTDPESIKNRIGFCRAALAVQPRSVVAWNNLGVALKAMGDLSGAVKAYEKAIAIDSRNAAVYNNLGNALRARGDPNGAIEACDRALAINGNYASAHTSRGAAFADLKRWDVAVKAHKKALEIAPTHADAHYNLGNALTALGDRRGAIDEYRAATECDDKFVWAYINLGVALRAEGNLNEAEKAYLKAIELRDNGSLIRKNLGALYYDLKNYPESIQWAKKAIAKNPDDAGAYAILGEAYLLLPDRWEARAAFKKAAQLDKQWEHLILKAPMYGAPWPREVEFRPALELEAFEREHKRALRGPAR